MKITKRQLRRIIKEEKAKLLRESMEELPPPGADRKKPVTTDALILADTIQYAVFDGLEELGVDAATAESVIEHLYGRMDIVKESLFNGLEDYKRKLDMSGKPKPRSI